jgi:CheY-like chemotaxis protein
MSNELILIVDDDPNARMLLREVLGFAGYRTIEAQTGEAGVELAHASLPDLVVMDVRLPGISGIEALRRLRQHGPTNRIPVIAVSASVMDYQQQEVRAAGFDAFEHKPINLRGLVRTVGDLLARASSRRDEA